MTLGDTDILTMLSLQINVHGMSLHLFVFSDFFQQRFTVFCVPTLAFGVFLVAQLVKNLPAIQETPQFYSWVGKIPWRRAWQSTPAVLPGESLRTEEPGGLQSLGSQRVGRDWAAKHSTLAFLGPPTLPRLCWGVQVCTSFCPALLWVSSLFSKKIFQLS